MYFIQLFGLTLPFEGLTVKHRRSCISLQLAYKGLRLMPAYLRAICRRKAGVPSLALELHIHADIALQLSTNFLAP